MASVPYTPYPEVAAEGIPARAHDYEDIQTSPEMFGAGVGRATAALGGQIEQTSQEIFQTQVKRAEIQNHLWANDTNTTFTNQLTNIYSEFQKNRGADAVGAFDKYKSDIQNLYRSTVNSAPNLMTKQLVSDNSRYYADFYMRAGTSYVDQQRREWTQKSLTDQAQTYASTMAMAVQSPEDFDKQFRFAQAPIRALAQINGLNGDAEVAKFNGQVLPKIIGDVAAEDPGRAEAIYSAYKNTMDASGQYAATRILAPYLAQEKGQARVGQLFATQPAPAPTVVNPVAPNIEQLAAAIHGQESGGAATSPTSVNGAMGPMQILPKTFDQYKKPGEVITNPADNLAVGQRIIADYARKYDNDPARVAVAYFSGPGNVAPKDSATPWITDAKDGNGKSVSSYVSDVLGRLGTPQVTQASARGDRIGQLDAMTKNDPPAVRNAAFAELKKRFEIEDANYTDQERYHRLVEQQAKDKATNRENELRQTIFGPNPGNITAAQVVSDPAFQSAAGRESADRILSLLEGKGNAASRLSHATAVDLINRMNLPEGDPNRVGDMSPIDQAYGQNTLTNADYQFVSKRFLDARTPDGDVLQKREAAFMKSVAPLIDKSNPLMGNLDPSGQQHLYELQFAIDQKIAAYRKEGKDPFSLFDPSKPDYMGNPDALRPYQKPLQESLRDQVKRITSGGAPAGPVTPPNARAQGSIEGQIIPLPPAPLPANRPPPNPGETAEAYMKRLGL